MKSPDKDLHLKIPHPHPVPPLEGEGNLLSLRERIKVRVGIFMTLCDPRLMTIHHKSPEVRKKRFNYYLCVLCVFVVTMLDSGLSGLAQGPTYAGVAKCKLCHPKQHKIWSESKHARAFEVLPPEARKDSRCLACHVTGYRETGEVKPEMAGVQCEACHGPGSLFITIHAKKDKEGAQKAGLIARPDPERCKTCHNQESPNFKDFDYVKMWEQIKH